MFEIKIILISKSEALLGALIDQGEFEVKEGTWIPFTRLRLGLVFITFDFIKFQTKPSI